MPQFGIHGLWPNFDDGTWPQFCDDSRPFDPEKIDEETRGKTTRVPGPGPPPPRPRARTSQPLPTGAPPGPSPSAPGGNRGPREPPLPAPPRAAAMAHVWPSLSSGNDHFWAHEWNKHGTCSRPVLDDEAAYFGAALDLHRRFDLDAVLAAEGIDAGSGGEIETRRLVEGIRRAFGVAPVLECVAGDLLQVYLCVGRDLQAFGCRAGTGAGLAGDGPAGAGAGLARAEGEGGGLGGVPGGLWTGHHSCGRRVRLPAVPDPAS